MWENQDVQSRRTIEWDQQGSKDCKNITCIYNNSANILNHLILKIS